MSTSTTSSVQLHHQPHQVCTWYSCWVIRWTGMTSTLWRTKFTTQYVTSRCPCPSRSCTSSLDCLPSSLHPWLCAYFPATLCLTHWICQDWLTPSLVTLCGGSLFSDQGCSRGCHSSCASSSWHSNLHHRHFWGCRWRCFAVVRQLRVVSGTPHPYMPQPFRHAVLDILHSQPHPGICATQSMVAHTFVSA